MGALKPTPQQSTLMDSFTPPKCFGIKPSFLDFFDYFHVLNFQSVNLLGVPKNDPEDPNDRLTQNHAIEPFDFCYLVKRQLYAVQLHIWYSVQLYIWYNITSYDLKSFKELVNKIKNRSNVVSSLYVKPAKTSKPSRLEVIINYALLLQCVVWVLLSSLDHFPVCRI